jgi:hypothetical protein
MTLDIEGVVNGGMDGEKSLGRAMRFEPLDLPFASPQWKMRVLRSAVLS